MARIGDTWVTIPEAAVLAGVPVHTMRRRVKRLHGLHPEIGLLRRPGKREFLVSAEALQRALSIDPVVADSELDAVRSRLSHIEDIVHALRKANRALRAEVKALKAQRPAATEPKV